MSSSRTAGGSGVTVLGVLRTTRSRPPHMTPASINIARTARPSTAWRFSRCLCSPESCAAAVISSCAEHPRPSRHSRLRCVSCSLLVSRWTVWRTWSTATIATAFGAACGAARPLLRRPSAAAATAVAAAAAPCNPASEHTTAGTAASACSASTTTAASSGAASPDRCSMAAATCAPS